MYFYNTKVYYHVIIQTQDIKMGNFGLKCNVPHQWIAQRQVGPMSTVMGWGVMSSVCGMAFQCGS